MDFSASGFPVVHEEFEGRSFMWDLYSRMLRDRIIWLGSAIDDTIAGIVIAQLLYLDTHDRNKDIQLYINSPGGQVSSGLAIYDTMNYVSCDVSTICVGMAASMGSFLLSAGAPGKRFVLPNAEVMIHQPLGGARGQTSDILIHAEFMKKCRDRLNSIMAKNTGQPLEVIARDTDRDYFMTAEEAVAYGLADKVIDTRPGLDDDEDED